MGDMTPGGGKGFDGSAIWPVPQAGVEELAGSGQAGQAAGKASDVPSYSGRAAMAQR